MNRRIFLKLMTYTSIWLGFFKVEPGLPKSTHAQSAPAPLPVGSYGAGAYGQGTYGLPAATGPSAKTYLPLITNEE